MATTASTAPAKRLYVRPSSGLIRTIGAFGAMVFGIHCISLSSSGFIPFSWVASVWPGASIVGVLTIAMIMALFHSYTYAAIGSTMPRSGADYTLASRVLSPPLAFAASFTLVVFSGVVAGGLIAWIAGSALPTLFRTLGVIFSNATFMAWTDALQDGTTKFVIGSVFLVITWASMLLPTRRITQLLGIGFILGIIAWVVIYFSLLSAPGPQYFQAQWDKFMGAGSYAARIDIAKAAGMVTNPDWTVMSLAGLIMGFWIYYGYYIPTFFAGEVKQASRTLLTGAWSSLIISWLIFTVAAVLLERLTPLEWIAAEGYIFNNGVKDAAGTVIPAMPWITFYAAILQPNLLLVLAVAVGWIYTLVNLGQAYFFYVSRIVFAWAFDRVVPEKIAYVHPKMHSPIVAVTLIAILAEYGLWDASMGGGILNTQLNFAFFAVCTNLVPVLAMTLFPYVKPDLFAQAPDIVKKKIGNIPVVSIIGVITLIYLVWMIIATFLFPAAGIAEANRLTTYAMLIAFFVLGFVIFYVSRWYRMRKEGIDLNWTFQSIPPV